MKHFIVCLLLAFLATATFSKILCASTRIYSFFFDAGIFIISVTTAHILITIARHFMPRKVIQDLDKKAVFITGCDSGFGHMCAKRLDALGVTVYAGCLFPEGAGAAQLKAAASSRLHVVPLDVTRDEDVRRAVEYVKQTIGDKKFWCVLNNAGILSDLLLEHNSMGAVRRVMEVNALGVVSVTQGFLPVLGDVSGRVVCVVSIFGHVSVPFCVPYCMSKYAALAYVQGLRRELQFTSSGVTVHGIEPSVYRTPLSDSEIRIAQIKKQIAGSPEDIQKKVNELYIEKYKLFYRRAIKITSNLNENEVVDCMIDAAIGSKPKPCYRPNVRCLVEGWLLEWIPTAVVDWALTTAARILASDLLDTTQS